MSNIGGLAGRRIVVIDDDETQSSTLATLLRMEGIVASCQNIPATAVALISKEPPDAIVVDVRMPDLSGTELLSAVRVHHPSLPAVFVTAYESYDPHVQTALGSERVAYVRKPVDMPCLLQALASLLR